MPNKKIGLIQGVPLPLLQGRYPRSSHRYAGVAGQRLLERSDWHNHCTHAISPGTVGGLDSPCPWLPQLLLLAGWDVAALEQALALAEKF